MESENCRVWFWKVLCKGSCIRSDLLLCILGGGMGGTLSKCEGLGNEQKGRKCTGLVELKTWRWEAEKCCGEKEGKCARKKGKKLPSLKE